VLKRILKFTSSDIRGGTTLRFRGAGGIEMSDKPSDDIQANTASLASGCSAAACPRCGGDILKDEQTICDGCIAEDVAISFEEDFEREHDDPNQCLNCSDNLDENEMCVHCDY